MKSTPPTECRNRIEVPGSVRTYPRGTELFHQGSSPQTVYIIDRGLVKLIRSEQDGQEAIVGLRYSGSAFGIAAAILEKPQPVTAVTLTPSHLHCFGTQDLMRLIKTDTQFSWQLHLVYSREVYLHATQLAELGAICARQRLEHLLWELLELHEETQPPKRMRLKLPLKHWEIAELLAVTPEHLSRMLKRMQLEGLISQTKDTIVVGEPQKLWHPADLQIPRHRTAA